MLFSWKNNGKCTRSHRVYCPSAKQSGSQANLSFKFSTVNREIFVYENIYVLNIRVNKFSRVPHENILTRKFVKLKLLCTYHQLSHY